VVWLWIYLLGILLPVILPYSQTTTRTGARLLGTLLVIAGFHLIVSLICSIKGGLIGRLKYGKDYKETKSNCEWKGSKCYRMIVRSEYYYLYLLGFVLLALVFERNVSGAFLFSCLTLYFVIAGVIGLGGNGRTVLDVWGTSSPMLRVLIVVVNCLLLIANVQIFATSQFGSIAKHVGGGKPETAYIRFSPQQHELAQSLNIPVATNLTLGKGFVGPIAVLLRSDKELIFYNYAQTNSTHCLTNEVIPMQSRTLTATQVRTDLIDALIFTK